MKECHEKLREHDRTLEKNFKKEFPGLGFNQLEALNKCFRKRPRAPGVIEKTVGVMIKRRNVRQDSSATTQLPTRAQKDLKTKSIASALERVRSRYS